MKRRAIFTLFSFVFLGSFVSAYYGNSYGNGFSFQGLFSNTDPSFIFSLLFFLILFVFFNYSLSRVFVENRTVPTVISLSLSTGIVYWMNISNSLPNLNLGNLFYGAGLSRNFLFTLTPLLLLGILIYIIYKLKRNFFLIFGILFLILGIFNVVYENEVSMVLGVLFLLIWFWRRRVRNSSEDYSGGDYPKRDSRFWRRRVRNPSEDYPKRDSRSTSRQIYKKELANRRYFERAKEAQIKARARNISKIRNIRERRDAQRKLRRKFLRRK